MYRHASYAIGLLWAVSADSHNNAELVPNYDAEHRKYKFEIFAHTCILLRLNLKKAPLFGIIILILNITGPTSPETTVGGYCIENLCCERSDTFAI
jgi:hypothetical protein